MAANWSTLSLFAYTTECTIMASEGSVFQRADGKWCAKWKDAQGKWRYLYASTKTEVRRKLRQALLRIGTKA